MSEIYADTFDAKKSTESTKPLANLPSEIQTLPEHIHVIVINGTRFVRETPEIKNLLIEVERQNNEGVALISNLRGKWYGNAIYNSAVEFRAATKIRIEGVQND